MSELISIIIPVYNHEEALKETLDSVFAQTYRPIEVIVVDDGSDKEIRKLEIEKLGIRKSGLSVYPDITVLRQENKGAPAARNRGFTESKGEYVIFWDADFVAKPEMLEKMKQSLDEHPNASYAYCNYYFGSHPMSARAFDGEVLKKQNYISSLALIRMTDVVPWDESLKRFQDWDVWLTLLEQGKTGVWVPEYLARSIPHTGGMSSWLPAFAYQWPWKFLPGIRNKFQEYEKARNIVLEKHTIK